MATKHTAAVGAFDDRAMAEQAIDSLHQAGFTDEQIGLALRDQEGAGDDKGVVGNILDEGTRGTVAGTLSGGVAGGLLGAAVAGLIPGIGPVIAAGALASILGGAAIGAGTVGLVGSLLDLGVAEDEAYFYEHEFKSGRSIVVVRAGDRYSEAMQILRDHNARLPDTPPSTEARLQPPAAEGDTPRA